MLPPSVPDGRGSAHSSLSQSPAHPPALHLHPDACGPRPCPALPTCMLSTRYTFLPWKPARVMWFPIKRPCPESPSLSPGTGDKPIPGSGPPAFSVLPSARVTPAQISGQTIPCHLFASIFKSRPSIPATQHMTELDKLATLSRSIVCRSMI